MSEYNLAPLVHNGYIYAEVQKGMYGLPQAGYIANECLTKFLAPHGYALVPVTHQKSAQFEMSHIQTT